MDVTTCCEEPIVPTSTPICNEESSVPAGKAKKPTKKRKFGTVINEVEDAKQDKRAICPTPDDCANGCSHEQKKKKRKTKQAKKENAPGDSTENIERIVIPNVPPVILKPDLVPLLNKNLPYVIFDLETTGFRNPRHITQIAAISQSSFFSRFVRPKVPIEEGASNATRIQLVNNVLHHKGERVEAVSISKALEDFLIFLGDGPVVLVGHNSKTFDCKILYDALEACDKTNRCNKTSKLNTIVAGFLDTLGLIKKTHPGLGKNSYKQVNLADYFFKVTYDAHDAREDVKILKRMFEHVKRDHEDQVLNFTFTTESVYALRKHNAVMKQKFRGYEAATFKKAISTSMAETAAGSGLTYQYLQHVYSQYGTAGIASVFSEVTERGKPRVTKNRKVIEKLSGFLESKCMSRVQPNFPNH